MSVDDLYVTEVDTHFDRLKHNLKTIKVFKEIADTIIDFVSQIEDFQKKLWEKKKFVLSTEWVITIDRLVEYVGEEAARPILEEVVKNEKQVAEWMELFGKEVLPKWENLTLTDLVSLQKPKQGEIDFSQGQQEGKKNWKKLPIDTMHFGKDFKERLLNLLSDKVDLDEVADGLVIHSDNYHGLSEIKYSYDKSIKCLYIDPPYNSGYSEILYKNTFKHSSWISLMKNRIDESLSLLKDNAIHVVAIDENEQENLGILLGTIFGDQNQTCVTIIHNPSGQQSDNFSFSHEFAYFNYPKKKRIIGLENREDDPDIRPLRDVSKGNHLRTDAANCFYPIYVKDQKIIGFGDVCEESFHPEGPNVLRDDGIMEIYPIDAIGEERKWVFARNTVESIVDQLTVEFNKQRKIYDVIRRKTRFNFKTVWAHKKYSANSYGAKILNNIFGKQLFSFPKSVYTVKDCVGASTHDERNAIVLDYFAGSGTTFHATQLLNREDKGKRKCILIEQGGYVYSVILPRIKKIAYTFDWKDGKPKNGSMNGLGVFFKYQRLEQYEEALENIAFNAPEEAVQLALEYEDYIPKYFLEFETKGSPTLVNTADMQDPWNYPLKVWDGFTYDTQQTVDLVETFNYLIGLHLQQCITKAFNGKKYQFILGNNNAGKQLMVVWRSVKDWTLDDYKADSEVLQQELSNFTYDTLYINGQAHIEGYQPVEEIFKNKMMG